jgi:hypothetical protein
MKVTLTESGGWANISTGCTVDTVDLPPAAAYAVESALDEEKVFADHPSAPDARDARIVVIEVENEDGVRRASFSEASPPPGLRVVLRILRPYCTIMPAS